MTPTPFCCDTNSGSEQERNEFKRIFEKASEVDWSFNSNYYGFNYLNEWDSWNRLENIKMYFNGNILPLSEGIAILKKMIGEEEKPKEITFTEEDMIKCFKAGVDFARNVGNPSNSEYIMSVITSKIQPKP